jgi:tripartite-type tricarboxylate transporter receptor subunit TctC
MYVVSGEIPRVTPFERGLPGQVPAINTPEEFAAEIKADRAAAAQVVNAAGLQPQ